MTDQAALLAVICGHDLTDPDAIRARHAEDTPRLAFADWLEEHAGEVACPKCFGGGAEHWADGCSACSGTGRISNGFAARAEFIRVQVELARCDGVADPNCGRDFRKHYVTHGMQRVPCPDCWAALRHREQELQSGQWMLDAFAVPGLAVSWIERSGLLGWFSNEDRGHPIDTNLSRGFVSALTCTWTDWRTHAAAILERQPVERVRLTTIPVAHVPDFNALRNWKMPAEWGGDVMWSVEAEWPAIEFKLPGIQA